MHEIRTAAAIVDSAREEQVALVKIGGGIGAVLLIVSLLMVGLWQPQPARPQLPGAPSIGGPTTPEAPSLPQLPTFPGSNS